MDTEREDGEGQGLRNRGDAQSPGSAVNWGAADSLRNATRSADEITPLLDNNTSEDDGKRSGEPEWEGFAEFEGLSWWHRPSVSL